jgi:hypothetical protein
LIVTKCVIAELGFEYALGGGYGGCGHGGFCFGVVYIDLVIHN